MTSSIIEIQNLEYSYGAQKKVLCGVTLSIPSNMLFGLLGPNGSGKTTLFRILSTLLMPEEGQAEISGLDLKTQFQKVREKIGIVFQSPSLDPKLTVRENLTHQGHLYGLSGAVLKSRVEELLKRLGITDRQQQIVATLSGGLKRRVELAKGLLHKPELLLLDEPSTGLDPAARLDLWNYLKNLRDSEGITVVATTHLMDEAESCDKLAIMHQGKIVAFGSPSELKSKIGGDVIVIKPYHLEELKFKIQEKFKIESAVMDGHLQIEHSKGHKLATELVENFPGQIESFIFRRPTLEDVFVHETGYQFQTL